MLVQPISRNAAERRAVATVYEGLAHFATERASGVVGTPLPSVSTSAAARELLREAVGFGGSAEHSRMWENSSLRTLCAQTSRA